MIPPRNYFLDIDPLSPTVGRRAREYASSIFDGAARVNGNRQQLTPDTVSKGEVNVDGKSNTSPNSGPVRRRSVHRVLV